MPFCWWENPKAETLETDGAAGAVVGTTGTGATKAALATGSWLPHVPHRAPLTFIY